MPDLEGRPGAEVLREPAEVDEEELERAVHAGQVVVGGDAAVGVVLDLGEAQSSAVAARSSGNPEVVTAAAPMLDMSG